MPDAFRTLDASIGALTDALLTNYAPGSTIAAVGSGSLPDTDDIMALISQLKQLLFPGYFHTCTQEPPALLTDIAHRLNQQIAVSLHLDASSETTQALTIRFLERLPEIRDLLQTDLEAFYDGDPAATSLDEIIIAYPGLQTILVYRVAHVLFELGVPLIPRIMTEHAHSQTGIDIHPGATIGRHFFIDHGTGIVIGETTVIGDHVKLYQGVTLGALSTRGGQRLRGKRRHPTIEDRVTIYSGASVLGGDTVIGHDAVIGGNAFITTSVAPGMRVSMKNQELDMRPGKQRW